MPAPKSFFHREQKIWTQAQMMAKLAERTHQPSGAGQPPQAESEAKLQWCTPEKGATAVKTVCGRYSCTKPTVMGKTQYELFKRGLDGKYTGIAYQLESFEEAKRRAHEDVNR